MSLLIFLALPLACHAATDTNAARWLDRARDAIGLSTAHERVLRLTTVHSATLADESDRSYGPFIVQPSTDTVWLDPITGIARVRSPGVLALQSWNATFRVRDSTIVPDSQLHSRLWSDRAADPWATLLDWVHGPPARVAQVCRYHDYDRAVLTHKGQFGEERLYLDQRTAVPVLLERMEAHYFLGPIRVGYVYESWYDVGGGGLYPLSTTRLVDDSVADSWYVDGFNDGATLMSRSATPAMAIPDTALVQAINPAQRFRSDMPDTVNVGAGTYLLVNPSFTSVVTLQADTVYVFDAPAGEPLAANDARWVSQLFPRRRATVFVAMNAVWPHIAGLRYWVAHGATVIASRPIVPYLESVIARRWTALPDELERLRSRVTPRFVTVSDSALVAGGRVRLYTMEGIDGETDLMAYIAPSRFVWASDHIQVVSSPNTYVDDVRATAARHGLSPLSTSGPHFRVLPWAVIDTLPPISERH